MATAGVADRGRRSAVVERSRPIVRQTDGFLAPAPDASSGVTRIRFATSLDGWIFGPELWATHDGGLTWARQSVPGVAGDSPVAALETAGGKVHAALYDDTDGRVHVATSDIGADTWRLSGPTVQIGAGPVPSTQIVLQGDSGWLIEVDRTPTYEGDAQLNEPKQGALAVARLFAGTDMDGSDGLLFVTVEQLFPVDAAGRVTTYRPDETITVGEIDRYLPAR